MQDDEIMQELRQVRADLARRARYDMKKLGELVNRRAAELEGTKTRKRGGKQPAAARVRKASTKPARKPRSRRAA